MFGFTNICVVYLLYQITNKVQTFANPFPQINAKVERIANKNLKIPQTGDYEKLKTSNAMGGYLCICPLVGD
ncbi:MAG TPA: hypothetical protein VKY45_06605 [Marinilabiliaceae bacterium]|nr:hypothetical protein [Marinilabiliaceae bacterium]